MKSALKYLVWTLLALAVIGGIAAPKVLPLLKTATKDSTAQAKSDGEAKSGGEGMGGEAPKGKSGSGGAALKVSTFVVKPAPFAEVVTSTGSLRADEGVDLLPETNGKIVAINFTEGTKVKKGDLLIKLNDADLRANLVRTTYSRELAKLKERRYAQLLSQKVVTQNDYDTALSDVNVEEANMQLYQAQIDKTEIRAPFDGVIGLRYVSAGAFVNATTRIATLQRLDKLKIDFAIPEKYTGRVRVGSPVTFSIAGGTSKFTGEIYAIDPRIDTTTRTLVIRAVAPNPEGRLLPGAFANVSLTLEQLQDALLIPSEAVIPGLEEKNVFVMNNGKAERRVVETGTRTPETIHILSGLKAGDVIITSGLQQLRAGQAVAASDAESKSSVSGDSPGGGEKKKGGHNKGGEGAAVAGTGAPSAAVGVKSIL